MAKKKTKKNVSHKAKVEVKEHVKKENDLLKKLIPKDSNAWLNAGIFVLIGLIIGVAVMFSAVQLQGGQVIVDESCDVSGVNTLELQNKVTSYLNENLVVDKTMVASVKDINEIDVGLFELNFEIKQDDQVVGAGVIYASENNLILPQAPAFNLNEVLKPLPEESEEPVEFQKAEVASSELYIWAYCPYGVTALTPFAEVAKTLGDDANLSVVLYYAGHGEYEKQQNKIQECIQEYSKEKYWDYAIEFVDKIYPVCGQSRSIDCDLEESIKLMDSLNINSDEILTCVETQGDDLINESYLKSQSRGVTGSPSLIVNGVKQTNVDRTADSYLEAICNGFESGPESCSTELSTSAGSTSGSC